MSTETLPALTGGDTAVTAAVPATPATAGHAAESTGTITCPINGDEIPACCCPLKK